MCCLGRSMDWTAKINMVNDPFLWAALTIRSRSHTPFVQAGAETYDTSAMAVKPDPRCSWQSHSKRVCAGVRDKSTESRSALQQLRIPSVIRPNRRTSVVVRWTTSCAAGTNGCFDLRCRAFPPGERVRAEWSKRPSSSTAC